MTTGPSKRALLAALAVIVVAAGLVACTRQPANPDIDQLVPPEVQPLEEPVDISLTGMDSGQLPRLDLELDFSLEDLGLETTLPEIELSGSVSPSLGSLSIPSVQPSSSDIQSLMEGAMQP